ncbi:MAG: sulfotransferase [Actinomycetota bacterium]|nr:sulfotransferase [Actinomycetota bacterium]
MSTVLFIGGLGRSGSTLLDRVTAEPGAFRAGPGDRATGSAVREFGRLVDGLVGERPVPRAGAR